MTKYDPERIAAIVARMMAAGQGTGANGVELTIASHVLLEKNVELIVLSGVSEEKQDAFLKDVEAASTVVVQLMNERVRSRGD